MYHLFYVKLERVLASFYPRFRLRNLGCLVECRQGFHQYCLRTRARLMVTTYLKSFQILEHPLRYAISAVHTGFKELVNSLINLFLSLLFLHISFCTAYSLLPTSLPSLSTIAWHQTPTSTNTSKTHTSRTNWSWVSRIMYILNALSIVCVYTFE